MPIWLQWSSSPPGMSCQVARSRCGRLLGLISWVARAQRGTPRLFGAAGSWAAAAELPCSLLPWHPPPRYGKPRIRAQQADPPYQGSTLKTGDRDIRHGTATQIPETPPPGLWGYHRGNCSSNRAALTSHFANHDASVKGYPFHHTRYLSLPLCRHESNTPSTSYWSVPQDLVAWEKVGC